MAKARSILKRLKAVKNIRKITRTMELIATARFKKAMDRATAAAAYTRKIAELASDLSQSAANFSHPLMKAHDPHETTLLLVLTSNRGLCGGYNSGVLKLAQHRLRAAAEKGEKVILEVSGKRGLNFLRFQRINVDQPYTTFEDKPTFAEVEALGTRYIEWYGQHKIDAVEVAYVRFLSASRQVATLERILPLARMDEAGSTTTPAPGGAASRPERKEIVEYEFLPSAQEILEEILPAAFKAKLFKCFLDAAVSEQIFRMVAMKGATENAGDMIGDLARSYNRARQAQITSELSEIIGGAEALG